MVEVWWRDRAECKDAPLSLVDAVFHGSGTGFFRDHYCKYCPVIDLCLAEAMETGEAGVWGGTTANARTLHGSPNYRHARPDKDRIIRA